MITSDKQRNENRTESWGPVDNRCVTRAPVGKENVVYMGSTWREYGHLGYNCHSAIRSPWCIPSPREQGPSDRQRVCCMAPGSPLASQLMLGMWIGFGKGQAHCNPPLAKNPFSSMWGRGLPVLLLSNTHFCPRLPLTSPGVTLGLFTHLWLALKHWTPFPETVQGMI